MKPASFNFVIPIILLLIFILLPATLSECLPTHRDYLLRLKQDFHPLNASANRSSLLPSWIPKTDCCKWLFVTCNDVSGEVVELRLGNLSIAGSVEPTALFNLTSLTFLDLSFNSLNFSRVSSSPRFELLTKLKHLNLSTSGFEGQVPSGIGKLTNLVELDLSNIYAFPPVKLENPSLGVLIQNLSNLEVLYLDYVNISDNAWSEVLPRCVPKLRNLSMPNCSLSGPIDASFSNLRFLMELRLENNNLSGEVPPFLGNLSSLTILRLASCRLKGRFPEAIFDLRNLTFVDVSNNPTLSGNLPETLGNLASLETLKLSGCNFSGQIPTSIKELTKLLVVDLSSNNFDGIIPAFESSASGISDIVLSNNNFTGLNMNFEKFKNLRRLDVRNNSLRGALPVSLFSLPQLQILLLSQNRLSGTIESIQNHSSLLQNLDLGSNTLQGPFPKQLFMFSGLRILICSSNNFSGTLNLSLLNNLRNLTNLDLSNNMLTVMAPKNSSTLPMLQTLKLGYCNLTVFPDFLEFQTSLSYLDLSGNRIAGDIPLWIWKVSNHLNLSDNLLTGFGWPQPDLNRSSLTVIDLHKNKLNGATLLLPKSVIFVDLSDNNLNSSFPPGYFDSLQFNVFFSVSRNNLFGSIPSSICKSTNILVLDLSYNRLNGTLPSCLAEMDTLTVLNLRENKLNGLLPSKFSNNCRLRTLNLNSNQFEEKLPESLSNCAHLEVIDVGNNMFSGSFPLWLGDFPELRVLVLRANRFEGPLGSFTSSHPDFFRMLQIIDISTNSFNGSLPTEIFMNLKSMMLSDKATTHAVQFKFLDLTRLYYRDTVMITSKGQDVTLVKIITIFSSVDVSNNKFEGSIPEVIGNLSSLFLLNMSHNMLAGHIPSSFGRLRQLESLDLSYNRLNGEIPPELGSLNFLSSLNLSYNNFSGRIPSGGQFDTFTKQSYLGDDSLCGPPLPKLCVETNNNSLLDSNDEPSWLYIFIGFGFGGGLALVLMPLIIWKEGRKSYNKHVDSLLLAFIPSCVWDWTIWYWFICRNGRVDNESEIEEASTDNKVGTVARPYCVFCTRLDFSLKGQVRIHHVECSCSKELQ